jgi:hypothetical protein
MEARQLIIIRQESALLHGYRIRDLQISVGNGNIDGRLISGYLLPEIVEVVLHKL